MEKITLNTPIDCLKTPDDICEYLRAVIDKKGLVNTPKYLVAIAKNKGIDINLTDEPNPTFDALNKAMRLLGLRLTLVPL